MIKWFIYIQLLLFSFLLQGCTQSSFNIKNLGKGDVDFVADAHRQQVEALLFELMRKLYIRNPNELKKQPEANIEVQSNRLKAAIVKGAPLLIDGQEGAQLLVQAFDPNFTGDRVFTAIGGMLSMVHKSYGYNTDFFLFDKLDKEKLFNSARNLEVFSWRLRTQKDYNGNLLLLSSSLNDGSIDVSFERLISKLISMQDMMAVIASDGDKRTTTGVVQGVAKAVFFPI